jgi:serine/threonine protein kinase
VSFAEEEGPGTIVDRYKLVRKIGEGGMGVVYMAEQEEPVRRRVALKIIKLGMDTRQVVARSEAERQALAMTDQPNIARVVNGGGAETGRPFLVMGRGQGVTIAGFCDQNKLPAPVPACALTRNRRFTNHTWAHALRPVSLAPMRLKPKSRP